MSGVAVLMTAAVAELPPSMMGWASLTVGVSVPVGVVVGRWVGGVGGARAPGSKPSAALEILEERFARGEIDKDEFDDRSRALQG